jgi:ribosome-binding ATPase YchF (GTP1/OBG family)
VAKSNQGRLPRTTVLVVGMPNVGKSSIINALRRLGVRRGKYMDKLVDRNKSRICLLFTHEHVLRQVKQHPQVLNQV